MAAKAAGRLSEAEAGLRDSVQQLRDARRVLRVRRSMDLWLLVVVGVNALLTAGILAAAIDVVWLR